MSAQSPTIFLSAGEASGEHYGALLLTELKARYAALGVTPTFFGMGGERMEALGCRRIVRAEDVAVMGITEIIRHIPQIYREYRKLKASIHPAKGGLLPDVAVLIDFPDIHLKLAEELHRLGVPVIFFVSPQLWAWKKRRIKRVQKYVSRMLVIFPFEEPFYRERGVDAVFVGHPLAELALPTISREEFAAEHGLDPARQWIGLLPGSRMKEIRANLPTMVLAACRLEGNVDERKEVRPQFVLPLAATLTSKQREEVVQLAAGKASVPGSQAYTHPEEAIRLVDDARAALHFARGSIVASGTATVEAALIGNPFVVVYRVSPLTYAIAKKVVTVPHVGMVNLIWDWNPENRLVPELIQDDFKAENIVQHLEPLLKDGPARSRMMADLAQVGFKLQGPAGRTAIEMVADAVMEIVGQG